MRFTQTPLLSGNTFYGSYSLVARYNSITPYVVTDTDGEITVSWSVNGTSNDIVDVYAFSSNFSMQIGLKLPFVKLTIKNTSANNQTHLKMNMIY
jgi:hypothetical protein